MKDKSTLTLRQILGNRFKIPAHQIRPADFKVLMSYFTIHDLRDLTEEEMTEFIATGKQNGMFFASRQ